MKLLYSFFLICVFLVFTACSDDDDAPPPNPIDLLPPATQTGENTFGCLLDGEAFLPAGGINPLDCVYQFVDGGYYFALQGNKRDEKNHIILIGVGTKNKEIEEGKTYQLLENVEGNCTGVYAYAGEFRYTSEIHTGELNITKLDFENNIVSGTFWFDVKDENGVIHEIRKGRFDIHFTQ